jgi:putative ABC transport system permease protein
MLWNRRPAPTNGRQDQAFGDQLLEHAAPSRSHGQPDGHLAAPPECPDQQQIADVGASDEEHEHHHRQSDRERWEAVCRHGSYSSGPIAVDGYQAAADEQPTVDSNEVGPGYFATMGIPLVSGRDFTRADNGKAPPVAVVNEAMVAQYWRGHDPVGQRLQVKGRWIQVVGVAKMSKYRNLVETSKPFFYVPLRQGPLGQSLQIRTALGPGAMARALVREIHALDANLAPSEIITMREQVDRTTAVQRVATMMLTVFGGLALLLAAIGLYGVMSYTVSQSTRELGLRMALGANASDLLRLVMSHGVTLTAGGVVLGAAAALGLTRLIGNLLYQVSPRDPLAFGAALLIMTIASLAACFVPAWRATRTDPVRALRL